MSVANEVYYDHDTVPQEYFFVSGFTVYLPLLLPLLLPLVVAGWSNFVVDVRVSFTSNTEK